MAWRTMLEYLVHGTGVESVEWYMEPFVVAVRQVEERKA